MRNVRKAFQIIGVRNVRRVFQCHQTQHVGIYLREERGETNQRWYGRGAGVGVLAGVGSLLAVLMFAAAAHSFKSFLCAAPHATRLIFTMAMTGPQAQPQTEPQHYVIHGLPPFQSLRDLLRWENLSFEEFQVAYKDLEAKIRADFVEKAQALYNDVRGFS